MKNSVLALDIGATKAAIALVDQNLKIIERIDVPTGSRIDIWDEVAVEIIKLISRNHMVIEGIGVGSAGPIHDDIGAISPVNIPNWREFPIVSKLKELLKIETSQIVLHGDAIALTHAEHKVGAGQGLTNMLGMVVSTGVGGGLILNGKLFTGTTGNAGYFGHHTIAFESDDCVCGRTGCVEMYASGPQMVRYAQNIGWQGDANTFEALSTSARLGDENALQSIHRGADALAQAIVNVLCILDINSVVVGGGVIQSGDIYWNALDAKVQEHAKYAKFIGDVDLRKSSLNKDAGLVGAALAYLDR
jgi:glucokinase